MHDQLEDGFERPQVPRTVDLTLYGVRLSDVVTNTPRPAPVAYGNAMPQPTTYDLVLVEGTVHGIDAFTVAWPHPANPHAGTKAHITAVENELANLRALAAEATRFEHSGPDGIYTVEPDGAGRWLVRQVGVTGTRTVDDRDDARALARHLAARTTTQ